MKSVRGQTDTEMHFQAYKKIELHVLLALLT